MWHECSRGDYPEDHIELLNIKREIKVVAVDDRMAYSVELRAYDRMLDAYVWLSQKRNIIAWMVFPDYVRSK